MMLIPRGTPVIQDINSYYIHLERLVEHFQGQIGSGGVHLRSSGAEAMLYFDETGIINAAYQTGETLLKGQRAIEKIFRATTEDNFALAVYRIDPLNVYFWASLNHTEPLYQDLSSEFTDLDGLIKKMCRERLTGFIEVTLGIDNQKGLLFFNNGNLIESSCAWGKNDTSPRADQDRLIDLSRESGGVFNVSRILLTEASHDAAGVENAAPKPTETEADGLTMTRDLLVALETAVANRSKGKNDFHTLLRRKCIEKADIYSFLDPFAGEFEYTGGQVLFTGNAGEAELCRAVAVCAKELILALGLKDAMKPALDEWRRKYARKIETFRISL